LLFASRNLLKPLMENVPDAPGVAAIGMTFKDPQAFAKRCKAAGLEVRKNALTLPAALGGTWILEKASA